MKKQICSIKHFERMLKQFGKKACTQIINKILFVDKKYPDSEFLSISNFLGGYTDFCANDLESLFLKLLNDQFKSNTFKTKSGVSIAYIDSVVEVNYTVEDENHNRLKSIDSEVWPDKKYITFRIYRKKTRKKLLVRWSVPMTWI